MFTVKLTTIDAHGKVWAERTLPYQDADSVARHVKEVIENHRSTSVKLWIHVHFPPTATGDDNATSKEGD